MSLGEIVESDFLEILGEGFAGTLSFGNGNGGDVLATISEITLQTAVELGGARPKRAFTATAPRSAFAGGILPKPGSLVGYSDGVFRVSVVKTRRELPLVEIEFCEK